MRRVSRPRRCGARATGCMCSPLEVFEDPRGESALKPDIRVGMEACQGAVAPPAGPARPGSVAEPGRPEAFFATRTLTAGEVGTPAGPAAAARAAGRPGSGAELLAGERHD